MGRKLMKGAVLVSGLVAAGASIYKAGKEFIEYKKLKNKDLYINAEMREISDLRPVIRASICTGEKEAGFKDKHGNFTSYMLIKSDNDIKAFKEKYGIEGEVYENDLYRTQRSHL